MNKTGIINFQCESLALNCKQFNDKGEILLIFNRSIITWLVKKSNRQAPTEHYLEKQRIHEVPRNLQYWGNPNKLSLTAD